MSQVPFPSRIIQVSGGSTVTSYSGSIITVQDAASGIVAPKSGNALIFNWDFGAHSGYAHLLSIPNSIQYCEVKCDSGLVVANPVGWVTTVLYSK